MTATVSAFGSMLHEDIRAVWDEHARQVLSFEAVMDMRPRSRAEAVAAAAGHRRRAERLLVVESVRAAYQAYGSARRYEEMAKKLPEHPPLVKPSRVWWRCPGDLEEVDV